MTTSLALRKVTSSALLNRLVRSASVTPSVFRSYNTNTTQMTTFDDDNDRSVDVDRRSSSDRSVSGRRDSFPSLFSDVFDPFSPTRSVNQLLSMMDQLMENPLRGMGTGVGSRRGWDMKEDDEALYIKMDMPGLDKEDVKVSLDRNTLVIKGESEKQTEDEEYQRRRYSTRLEIPANAYKLDGIKAEMKNGVLKMVVPKVKEDEKKDVFQVQVE